ncbi:hypothetical protein PIIN_06208 [Serendipita indica DSM 11827]|uniref:BRCT domain-containing protein n=1 Tax=Serendipita indica (strain DSM 11827) TaxID=1109443 RepID=G4TLT1_SERID|nr:hypothetical protein PIIN_06208 [Serendipita indica DSM 11827]
MPPRGQPGLVQGKAKGRVTRSTKSVAVKARTTAVAAQPAGTSSAHATNKRALPPEMESEDDKLPIKRFKPDVEPLESLAVDIETTSNEGSLPPSSADVSMSTLSNASDTVTVSAATGEQPSSNPNIDHFMEDLQSRGPSTGSPPPALRTEEQTTIPSTPMNAARLEISKTPKAPWLSSSKQTSLKFSPLKKAFVKPRLSASRTPLRKPPDLDLPSSVIDAPPVTTKEPVESTESAMAVDTTEHAAPSTSTQPMVPKTPKTATKLPVRAVPLPRMTPAKSRNHNVSAAFALPVSLSPTKTPGKVFVAKAGGSSSPLRPKVGMKPSILRRVGGKPAMGLASASEGDITSTKSPLSSTLAALMNRTTVDPHAATQAQLSTLSQALEELDAPRPPSSASLRPPLSRPATSLGLQSGAKKEKVAQSTLQRPAMPRVRPGTSMAITGSSRSSQQQGGSTSQTPSATLGRGAPPVSNLAQLQNASSVEARRASTASLMLSQSLPKTGLKPQIPPYRTSSGRRVVSAAPRAAPTSGEKDRSSEDVVMVDASQPIAPESSVKGGSSTNEPTRTAPLDILKDCIIYVDVRTEDGEDAGSLFVDMLRGLGAKILSRIGSSLTHIVYKSGQPSTLTRYRTLADPKPAVVGIAWVVECVEKRHKADTARYAISLEEEAGSILEGLKNANAKSTNTAKTKGGIQTKLQFKPAQKA